MTRPAPHPPKLSPGPGEVYQSTVSTDDYYRLMFKWQIPTMISAVIAGIILPVIGFLFIMGAVALNLWLLKKQMGTLTTTVDADGLHCWYGTGKQKAHFRLQDITGVTSALTPRRVFVWRGSFPPTSVDRKTQILWGKSPQALEIKFTNGKRLLLATEEPEVLAGVLAGAANN